MIYHLWGGEPNKILIFQKGAYKILGSKEEVRGVGSFRLKCLSVRFTFIEAIVKNSSQWFDTKARRKSHSA